MIYLDSKQINLYDFNSHGVQPGQKESHLHEVRPTANPNGSRAERREANKLKKKKGKGFTK